MTSVRRVALTGGIATGKSYCLAQFSKLGVPTIDADRLAHDAVAAGTPALAAVAERFGREIVQQDGSLDRAALGRLVFADAEARHDLERIVHPVVYAAITQWFSTLPSGTRFAVADIPLLYETGREHEFDAVIVTSCPPEQQLERLFKRGGLSDIEARQRIATQMPLADKVQRATHVIDTSGSVDETNKQVSKLARIL